MRHLRHEEIDKNKWDEAISNSLTPFPYALSWFLDIASPRWEALVWGKYDAVMPLPVKKRWGIPYLIQPPGCQQLGIFSHKNPMLYLSEALRFIEKRFPYIHLYFNYSNISTEFKKRTNLILPLDRDYEEITINYHTNLRRNLKKAQSTQLKIIEENNWKTLIDTFKNSHLGKKLNKYWLEKIESLGNEALKRKTARVYSVYSETNEFLTGAMFLFFHHRIIFWFSANTPYGKEVSAMHMLLNFIIKSFSAQQLVLDFEGSENSTLARFYHQFGSIHQDYYIFKKVLFF